MRPGEKLWEIEKKTGKTEIAEEKEIQQQQQQKTPIDGNKPF